MVIDRYSPGTVQRPGRIPAADYGQLCHFRRFACSWSNDSYGFAETVVYGVGSGLGWAAGHRGLMATIMQQTALCGHPPKGLEGFGISMIVTGPQWPWRSCCFPVSRM